MTFSRLSFHDDLSPAPGNFLHAFILFSLLVFASNHCFLIFPALFNGKMSGSEISGEHFLLAKKWINTMMGQNILFNSKLVSHTQLIHQISIKYLLTIILFYLQSVSVYLVCVQQFILGQFYHS